MKVKIHWYCGYFVGPYKWHGEIFEPDECDGETLTTESLEDYQEETCMAICPKCKAELWQGEGHDTLIKEVKTDTIDKVY